MPKTKNLKTNPPQDEAMLSYMNTLREICSPLVLTAVGLLDEEGMPAYPTLPLTLEPLDPPRLISIKSYMNCLHHLTQEKLAMACLEEMDQSAWFHNVRMAPPLFRLIREMYQQYHAASHFLGGSVAASKKYRVDVDLDLVGLKAMQENIQKNQDVSQYLHQISVMEASHGMKEGCLSEPFLKEVENTQDASKESTVEETVRINQATLDTLEQTYIAHRVKEKLLTDFLVWTTAHEERGSNAMSAATRKQLKLSYLPIRQLFASYAPACDKWLLNAIQGTRQDGSLGSVNQALRVLQSEHQQAANEALFTYTNLKKERYMDEAPFVFQIDARVKKESTYARLHAREIMCETPPVENQMGHYDATKRGFSMEVMAIEQADKLHTIRHELEGAVRHFLCQEGLIQLGLTHKAVMLPMEVLATDYPQVKCAKALLNGLYHAELGLRYYVKAQASYGFFTWIFQTFYAWRSESQIAKASVNLLQLKDRAASMRGHGSMDQHVMGLMSDTMQLSGFVKGVMDSSQQVIAQCLEEKGSLMQREGYTFENILAQCSTMLQTLSNFHEQPETQRAQVVKALREGLTSIQDLTAKQTQSHAMRSGFDALQSLCTLLQTTCATHPGGLDEKTVSALEAWFHTHLADLLVCMDRLEEECGFRHGTMSESMISSISHMKDQLLTQGVTLNLPMHIDKIRYDKTRENIAVYHAARLTQDALVKQAQVFYDALKHKKAWTVAHQQSLLTLYEPLRVYLSKKDPKMNAQIMQALAGQKTDRHALLKVKKSLLAHLQEGALMCEMKLVIANTRLKEFQQPYHQKESSAHLHFWPKDKQDVGPGYRVPRRNSL